MSDVNFHERFSPAEATRGSWVPIDTDTLSDYPLTGSRGRYTQLNYIVGSEPGALSLALSGGNVILPVSTVSITEPLAIENYPGQDLVVTQNLPDTTEYTSATIAATSVSPITFAQNVQTVEVFNSDTVLPVYVGFNNVALATLSAQALPVIAETFYSVDRDTTTLYIGNVDASSSIDVRVIGHYKA